VTKVEIPKDFSSLQFTLVIIDHSDFRLKAMKEEKEEEFEEAKELFKEGLSKILRATKKVTEKIVEGFREGYAQDVTKKENPEK
jgi:cellobiose-specific phosphotransferase system component IIA